MKRIFISDITIKKCFEAKGTTLSFKEKHALAKILDRICVDVIELPKLEDAAADSLLIKSIASDISNSILAVNADIYEDNIEKTWEALKEAKKPRLQVVAPVSAARMEYVYHKKPETLKESVRAAISQARSLCDDVEFIANDATRGDEAFLFEMIEAAAEAGATTISFSDTAGVLLPDEHYFFVKKLVDKVKAIDSNIRVGISCSDEMHLADACALAAIRAGADEIKTSIWPVGKASLEGLAKIADVKGEDLGVNACIRMTELKKAIKESEEIFENAGSDSSIIATGLNSEQAEVELSNESSYEDVMAEVRRLGYDLNDEDKLRVFNAFKKITKSKNIGYKELEALVATEALQVPEEYLLESYIVTTGNITDVMAHIKLAKDEEMLDGISLGDGPIDAAFRAIEKITGRHFDLDDFQISAITQGREAVGQTIVKLRYQGKAYSGSGTSTDIIGSAIKAYINALNKIVYEENN